MSEPDLTPDRLLILGRGDLRLALPIIDTVDDPTPLGIITSALPTILLAQRQAPLGVDVGPPLDDDATVLMLRVAGQDDPLVPDVGLLEQTAGDWTAGGPDEAGRTELTARVPELEVELIDVERPAIALRGAALELNVVSDQWDGERLDVPDELVGPLPAGGDVTSLEDDEPFTPDEEPEAELELEEVTVPLIDTGIGQATGYASDAELLEERERRLSELTPAERAALEEHERRLDNAFLEGAE